MTTTEEPVERLYAALTGGLGGLAGRLADPKIKRLAVPEDSTVRAVKANVAALAAELAAPAVAAYAAIERPDERLAHTVRAVREYRKAASRAAGTRNVALRMLLDKGVKASHGAHLVLINRTYVEREIKPHTTIRIPVDMPDPVDTAQREQAVVLYNDAVADGVLEVRDDTARAMKRGDYGRVYTPNEIGRIGGDEDLGGDGKPIPSGLVSNMLYGKNRSRVDV